MGLAKDVKEDWEELIWLLENTGDAINGELEPDEVERYAKGLEIPGRYIAIGTGVGSALIGEDVGLYGPEDIENYTGDDWGEIDGGFFVAAGTATVTGLVTYGASVYAAKKIGDYLRRINKDQGSSED